MHNAKRNMILSTWCSGVSSGWAMTLYSSTSTLGCFAMSALFAVAAVCWGRRGH